MEVMARYGDVADVAWKVGRIMLKYRPIAPKPVTGGAVAAGPIDTKSSSGRGKRKGAASGAKDGSRRGRKSTKRSPPAPAPASASAAVLDAAAPFMEDKYINSFSNFSRSTSSPVVTLPLMPMTPDRKEESPATLSPTASDGHAAVSFFGKPTCQQHVGTTSINVSSGSSGSGSPSAVVVAPRPVRPVGSWVTVECVTDTWRDGEAGPLLGCCSPAGLERDACPVFVSDACDRVSWTNAAYKRMVVGPGGDEEGEEVGAAGIVAADEEKGMRVALATRGMVPLDPAVTCFTCMVRVRYACRRRGKVSMAAPCDVWRLAGGRLAWRLDVKAALCLSLGC